jgi:hypothetical protein
VITIRNKPGRGDDFECVSNALVDDGKWSQSAAASLQGKFVFSESQVYSRLGCRMLGELKARLSGLVTPGHMTPTLAGVLRARVSCLRLAMPKKLMVAETRAPLLFFTDAALKGKLATAGMWMLDRADGTCEMAGGVV